MSRTKFYYQFKLVFGISPGKYVVQEKIEKAKTLLSYRQAYSISHVAFSLGYSDSSYFTKQFKEIAGVAPSVFQKRALCM